MTLKRREHEDRAVQLTFMILIRTACIRGRGAPASLRVFRVFRGHKIQLRPRMMMARWLALCVLVVLAAPPLAAQAPADSTLVELLQEARTRRWIVRATTQSGMHHVGTVGSLIGDSVSVARQNLLVPELSQLERRMTNRRALKSGAIAGAVAGLALSTAFALEICQYNECDASVSLVVGAFTAGTAAIGGLIGGMMGGQEWRTVWGDAERKE